MIASVTSLYTEQMELLILLALTIRSDHAKLFFLKRTCLVGYANCQFRISRSKVTKEKGSRVQEVESFKYFRMTMVASGGNKQVVQDRMRVALIK